MYEIHAGASFADWVDALKEQSQLPQAQPSLQLEKGEKQRLDECARRYEQQSTLPELRRSRVNLMLLDAPESTVKSAVNYLAGRLFLRVSSLDARTLEGALDDVAAVRLHPLVDKCARLVLVTNICNGVDSRVRDALAWSSRNVLIVGTANSADQLGSNITRYFPYVMDHNRKSLLDRLGF